MIFDTHAHYDDEQFDTDREELLNSMEDEGVGHIINAASSYASVKRCVELGRKYSFVYGSVGIHPDELEGLTEETYQQLYPYFEDEKIVAVGEIGLDYYWDTMPRDVQKKWFIRQLDEARKRNLPVLIHSRDAAEDTLQVIKEHGRGLKGVMHSFSYSKEMAREYVKLGFFLGIGGVVTFKNGKKMKEVVVDTPIEHLLLETDAPYLTPEPFRGKRNSSVYLKYVVQEIASLKGLSCEEVIRITEENARKLIGRENE
ncbi:TatD DNase family protein [Aequitasia blattaphilus]|uniref:TatD family hydrolase n=1 Tax=Aequitasia blattaphilus TaxID=2949332 RepID=A0ABT1EC08_9FIRM|nr:TatD family hydrolase [Aequitasia blattaphilus]MCP1103364.1 TatD family hydrolase [Aequitasia blattaphilus]MCR8616004.1 TatD family hydrolase [Aequitasia blattaphilus]